MKHSFVHSSFGWKTMLACPSKQWYCGISSWQASLEKDILLRLAGSWILNGIVKIKQSERSVPACMLERRMVDTLTLAVVSLLLRGDGRDKCLLQLKSAMSYLQ